VTFLLFLASVGILEYLLRDVRQTSGRLPESRSTAEPYANSAIAGCGQPVSSATATSDLLSLGKALEAQKTASVPESEPVAKEV
jgi:hypothetical protein